jgi:hypothetical protein
MSSLPDAAWVVCPTPQPAPPLPAPAEPAGYPMPPLVWGQAGLGAAAGTPQPWLLHGYLVPAPRNPPPLARRGAAGAPLAVALAGAGGGDGPAAQGRRGTRRDPYCYWLPEREDYWRQDPLWAALMPELFATPEGPGASPPDAHPACRPPHPNT